MEAESDRAGREASLRVRDAEDGMRRARADADSVRLALLRTSRRRETADRDEDDAVSPRKLTREGENRVRRWTGRESDPLRPSAEESTISGGDGGEGRPEEREREGEGEAAKKSDGTNKKKLRVVSPPTPKPAASEQVGGDGDVDGVAAPRRLLSPSPSGGRPTPPPPPHPVPRPPPPP